ncbi:MAG: hypothetical protein ACTHM6_19050 [Tepidisphaeraceae bacterium]
MTKRLLYPDEFTPVINFQTGDTDMIAETPEQRRARLRHASSARRQAAFANSYAFRERRKEAIAEVWRRYTMGADLPIHFDIIHTSGQYRMTERFSLQDAALTNHVFNAGELVGSIGGIALRSSRPKAVAAHFVWPSSQS